MKTTDSLHMGSAGVLAQEEVASEVAERIGFFMRNVWPVNTAKLAARQFDCSPRTAEGWLTGQMPANRHLILMMRAWGKKFIAFVFEPAVGTSLQAYSIDQEFQDLKAQMARFEGALNAAIEDQDRAVAIQGSGPAHEAGVTAR